MTIHVFIRLIALMVGFSYATHVSAVPSMTRGAVNTSAGSFSKQKQRAIPPNIIAIAPNSCVAMGASITVIGSNFGVPKELALVIGASYQTLSVRFWQGSKILAIVPSKGLKANTRYPVAIKESRSKRWLSNTNKSILICPAKVLPSRYQKPQAPNVFEQKETTPPAPIVSSHPVIEPLPVEINEGNSNTPKVFGALPQNSGSLIGRQLPPTPPKLSSSPSSSDADNAQSEPNELMVMSLSMSEAQQLDQQLSTYGIRPKKRKKLQSLGLVMTTYRVPAGIDIEQTAASVRQAFPDMTADLNHRFTLQGAQRTTKAAKEQINWGEKQEQCNLNSRIGLLDTGINKNHPALKNQTITAYSVLSRGVKKAKQAHGTAIATLLVGSKQSEQFTGLLPSAELYSAAIFRQKNKRQIETTAEWIVSGVDWLLSQKVEVINMSVGGPKNLLVEIAMQRTLQSGVAVIAAAGNGGLKAKPVYPAAQQGVIAVTAVDSDSARYEKANAGPYIDFSAPGVDIWAGNEKGAGKYVSGTSFAVPFVTAAIAALKKNLSSQEAYAALKQTAQDLGQKGKDDHYGWGLIQADRVCMKN